MYCPSTVMEQRWKYSHISHKASSCMRYSPTKEMERWKFNINIPGCVKSQKRASLQKEQRVRIMFSLCASERRRGLLCFYQLTFGCFVVNSTHSSFSSLLTFINDHDSDIKITGAPKSSKTSALGNKKKVKQSELLTVSRETWVTSVSCYRQAESIAKQVATGLDDRKRIRYFWHFSFE